jgi:HAD superfamily hydrolase (TIGR01509 family)
LSLNAWAACIGTADLVFDPYADLETQYGRVIDRDAIRARRRPRWTALIAAQALLPGVEDYILDAKRLGLRLAVASSSSRAWVDGHLTERGIVHHFDCIRCADDVARTKPHPDLYLAVLSALDLAPDQALVFEDSPNGITAAKRAGITCVAVPNALTAQLAIDHADLCLASLASLPLEQLLAQVVQASRKRQ